MSRETTRYRGEWPTWIVLIGCYATWLLSLAGYSMFGYWSLLPAIVCVALHSSLQHEILHGHPTRSAALNEALIYPAMGLFIAYRSYKDSHLRHHNDTNLTDPYDDPESFYTAERDYADLSVVRRTLLHANQTLIGRWIVGPPLSLFALWHGEAGRLVRGDTRTRSAWLHHIGGLIPVLLLLIYFEVPLMLYALGVAWPGMSLIMTRSFIEHRAAPTVPECTAVVEAGPVMSLIYLNNNLHAVHHRKPSMPWYRLPAQWQQDREMVSAQNGNYVFENGYASVLKRWAFARREPVVHPYLRKR